MKLLIIQVGKTADEYLKEGIGIYTKRIANYLELEVETVKPSLKKDKLIAIQEEEKSILSKIKQGDFLVVLDEKGEELGSRQLAVKIQKWMERGVGRIVFIIGGAFGISPELKKRTDFIFSVSKLTFTHQMVRLILVEQIYRSMTILRNEGYHHD